MNNDTEFLPFYDIDGLERDSCLADACASPIGLYDPQSIPSPVVLDIIKWSYSCTQQEDNVDCFLSDMFSPMKGRRTKNSETQAAFTQFNPHLPEPYDANYGYPPAIEAPPSFDYTISPLVAKSGTNENRHLTQRQVSLRNRKCRGVPPVRFGQENVPPTAPSFGDRTAGGGNIHQTPKNAGTTAKRSLGDQHPVLVTNLRTAKRQRMM